VFFPARKRLPDVGRSRHPIWLRRVDFPDPDGPMMATNSPSLMVRDIPFNATTSPAGRG